MRVLHILDHSLPLHSGYAFRTVAILREQRALGWDTFHLTSPKQGRTAPPRETVEGYEFHRTAPATAAWSDVPLLRELALMRRLARRLGEVVAEVQPDLLHAHSPVLNALPALWVGRRTGLPVVYEVRASWEDAAVSHGTARAGGPRYRLSRAMENAAVKRADAVTVICEGLRTDLIGRGVAAEKITVIPNAVDLAHFARDPAKGDGAGVPGLADRLGLNGKTVLAFIGSFYGYEGLDVLLRALPHLRERDPAVRVLLVGGGPEEARLRQLAGALGVAEHVVFTGRVAHQEVPAYYELADLMIYPRKRIRLTEIVTPLKPLEAMAHGRIVVASDIGGHRELIRDGETGYFFAPDDPAALAATVSQAVAARAEWPQMIARAHRFVACERTWSASVERYRAVYGRLLGPRREDPARPTPAQPSEGGLGPSPQGSSGPTPR